MSALDVGIVFFVAGTIGAGDCYNKVFQGGVFCDAEWGRGMDSSVVVHGCPFCCEEVAGHLDVEIARCVVGYCFARC